MPNPQQNERRARAHRAGLENLLELVACETGLLPVRRQHGRSGSTIQWHLAGYNGQIACGTHWDETTDPQRRPQRLRPERVCEACVRKIKRSEPNLDVESLTARANELLRR
jgi:hypothetical protein